MKTNVAKKVYTHEGARAKQINPELQLRRSVMSCLLWEDNFYEDGVSIADRIKALIPEVKADKVASIAIEAREQMNLRHVPLLIVREMARLKSHKHLVKDTLSRVIQRADELTEFLSIYWMEGREPLSSQVKKGLAEAFCKFNEYQLAKYNRPTPIKLKDVLFLSHAKPKDKEQEELWKKLIDDKLETPDTWEVALSSGSDKKASWERLIRENKLGALAFLRNLRNMEDAKVDRDVIKYGFDSINFSKVLPFRYISAAKAVPKMEDIVDKAMLKNINQKLLSGRTLLVIDVSGSMYGGQVSRNSDMNRALAACTLGAIIREICEEPIIYATAGDDWKRKHQTSLVPNRRGIALVDAIYKMCKPLGGGGIFLNQVCNFISEREDNIDRMIVITDEQDCANSESDSPLKAKPLGKVNYMINVAAHKNGVGYGKWTHIDGFSEACMRFIQEYEKI